jgi:protein-disulfide isomerase
MVTSVALSIRLRLSSITLDLRVRLRGSSGECIAFAGRKEAPVRLGDALGLSATPSFVIKGVAILGYPGRKALESIIQSARRCGSVVC